MSRVESTQHKSEPDRSGATDVDEFVTALLTASRVLVAVAARSLTEIEDTVTVTQFRTLVVLDGHRDGLNLHGLADQLGVATSTAVRMVDRLLVAGLVTRQENPSDRREVLLGLTRDGRRVVRTVTARRRKEIARIVSAMPTGRRGELLEALSAFAVAAAEPTPQSSVASQLAW